MSSAATGAIVFACVIIPSLLVLGIFRITGILGNIERELGLIRAALERLERKK